MKRRDGGGALTDNFSFSTHYSRGRLELGVGRTYVKFGLNNEAHNVIAVTDR